MTGADKWWFVGPPWGWQLSRPAPAYLLISDQDCRLRQRAEWWCVPVVEHGPYCGIPLDRATAFWPFDWTAERVALLASEARADARFHPIREMRALYERCAEHLDFEARRLAAKMVRDNERSIEF